MSKSLNVPLLRAFNQYMLEFLAVYRCYELFPLGWGVTIGLVFTFV